VLIAQTIAQLRADAQHDDAILKSLTEVLNGGHRPDFLDEIRVTEINIGEEFPIFSNCRIIPVEEGSGLVLGEKKGKGKGLAGSEGVGGGGGGKGRWDGATMGEGTRLQARMDVDLSDVITLGVETKLILNWPRPVVAVLPVALAVSVVRFSGTVSAGPISLGTPTAIPASTYHPPRSTNG